jgi:excisionase family DNA binding protein
MRKVVGYGTMPPTGETRDNIRVINGRGASVYTVDEVSVTLSVPRPTLYRYLKEYAIPYLRRGGRISIPEESLDRIRTVRELHEEGLGTEAVRRRLQEGPDLDRIAERMDRVQEKLEGLREGPAYSSDAAFVPQALRTILARQTVLISAVISMSEMLEELLAASGRPRKTLLPGVEDELLPRGPKDPTVTIERDRLETDESPARPTRRRKRFGDLARRRRRVALSSLATMVVLVGTWGVLFFGGA